MTDFRMRPEAPKKCGGTFSMNGRMYNEDNEVVQHVSPQVVMKEEIKVVAQQPVEVATKIEYKEPPKLQQVDRRSRAAATKHIAGTRKEEEVHIPAEEPDADSDIDDATNETTEE